MGPGTIAMWGGPWEHDIQWAARRGEVQSQALAAGERGHCLVLKGKEGRVEGGGRGGLGPGTGQRTNPSRFPHCQGCRCWGTCFGCPGQCL